MTQVLLTKMPSLKMHDYLWYNFSDVSDALDHMILAIPELEYENGFR